MAGPSPAATLAQPVTIREIMRERLGRDAPKPPKVPAHFDLLSFLRAAKDFAPEEPAPDSHPESRGHGQPGDPLPGAACTPPVVDVVTCVSGSRPSNQLLDYKSA